MKTKNLKTLNKDIFNILKDDFEEPKLKRLEE
jgi:hypothetical protein